MPLAPSISRRTPAGFAKAVAKLHSSCVNLRLPIQISSQLLPPQPWPMNRKRTFPPPVDESLRCYPWKDHLPTDHDYSHPMERLHYEILGYTKWATLKPTESKMRTRIIDEINSITVQEIPQGKFSVFGSSATGLCLPTSDIDLVITIPKLRKNSARGVDLRRQRMANLVHQAKLTDSVSHIPSKIAPILHFKTLPMHGSLTVDLGFNNKGGEETARYINNQLRQLPALKPLILVTKTLFSLNNLNTAFYHGLCSHAISLLCISLLQINPNKRAESWLKDPVKTRSLGYLLSDMFYYFGTQLDPAKSFIDPEKDTAQNLRFASPKYLRRTHGVPWLGKEYDRGTLAIHDPADHKNNASRALTQGSTQKVLHLFKDSYERLSRLTLADENILGSLIYVSQSEMDYRANLERITADIV